MEPAALDDLIASLRVSRRRRRAIARELQTHLEETRRELALRGWSPDEAARESVRRLGDLHEIVEGFGQVYRPTRRTRLVLAFSLAGTLLLGVYGRGGLASATPAHRTPHATHAAVVHKHATTTHRCHHGTSQARYPRTTMFTSLSGTVMTLTTSFPSR